jgi:hypothetical protein
LRLSTRSSRPSLEPAVRSGFEYPGRFHTQTKICHPGGMSDPALPPETPAHALAVVAAPAETVASTAADDLTILRPPAILVPVPLDQPPARVCAWFDEAAEAIIPDDDGTLATARIAADAYANRCQL